VVPSDPTFCLQCPHKNLAQCSLSYEENKQKAHLRHKGKALVPDMNQVSWMAPRKEAVS